MSLVSFARLLETVGAQGTQNMISGFRTSGIYPLDPQEALMQLPALKLQLSTPPSCSSSFSSVCRDSPPCLTPTPCHVLEHVSSFKKRLMGSSKKKVLCNHVVKETQEKYKCFTRKIRVWHSFWREQIRDIQ